MVAGKTGTAQKVNLEQGGYYSGKYISSFVGFLPVENPAISIIVVADEPTQSGYYGGTVCAPYFAEIADQTVRYLRIPPEGFTTEYVTGVTSGEETILD
jgi:cell division protein FtsI/penicillin-binding protein 2